MDERNNYNSIPMQPIKTAMQELIDELELIKGYPMMPLIIRIAKDRLEKEKEQIINAWNDGDYSYFYDKETGRDFEDGKEYYNKIYN